MGNEEWKRSCTDSGRAEPINSGCLAGLVYLMKGERRRKHLHTLSIVLAYTHTVADVCRHAHDRFKLT